MRTRLSVTVPRLQKVQKLNVLMAANQAPDIVFTYDTPTVEKYVQQGGVTELGGMMDQYGGIQKQVLDSEDLIFGVFGGKQYAIPALRC